ncbi:MAG: hypothetical protein NTV57_06970 [Cyanobacteria bacterium]|nr:hypothetical protein [Cyanobacteriota bacterium]
MAGNEDTVTLAMPVSIDNGFTNVILDAAGTLWIIRRPIEVAGWSADLAEVDGRLILMGGTKDSMKPAASRGVV